MRYLGSADSQRILPDIERRWQDHRVLPVIFEQACGGEA
jgi:hypothetical protein